VRDALNARVVSFPKTFVSLVHSIVYRHVIRHCPSSVRKRWSLHCHFLSWYMALNFLSSILTWESSFSKQIFISCDALRQKIFCNSISFKLRDILIIKCSFYFDCYLTYLRPCRELGRFIPRWLNLLFFEKIRLIRLHTIVIACPLVIIQISWLGVILIHCLLSYVLDRKHWLNNSNLTVILFNFTI
jgi:hypothetical protein